MSTNKLPVSTIIIEVAPADLIDRITVLEVKSERLINPAGLRNVTTELAVLRDARDKAVTADSELTRLAAELRKVNETLWDLEEEVRRCEARKDFGAPFIAAARSIISSNDRRAALKRAINQLLGARFQEEKSYPLPEQAIKSSSQ